MKFSRSTVLVGEGRLTGAVKRGAVTDFFIDSDGVITKKSMTAGRRGVISGGFVSYASDYTETASAAFSMSGNELTVKPLENG